MSPVKRQQHVVRCWRFQRPLGFELSSGAWMKVGMWPAESSREEPPVGVRRHGASSVNSADFHCTHLKGCNRRQPELRGQGFSITKFADPSWPRSYTTRPSGRRGGPMQEKKRGRGRPGITEEDVRLACEELKAQGRKIGPVVVRLQLGRGGYQTIIRHLRNLGYGSDDSQVKR
jgi:hypothetical protein